MTFPTTPRTWADNDALSTTNLNGGVRDPIQDLVNRTLFAYKTADESVNSGSTGTTFQNDNHLLLPVVASAVYDLFLMCDFNSPAAADFKLQWTYPAGLTMRYGLHCIAVGGTNEFTFQSDQSTVQILEGPAGRRTFFARGLVLVGGTAGTLQLQWAQNTANASDTTVYQNSFLRLDRMV